MVTYPKLAKEQRYQKSAFAQQGPSQTGIARVVGVDKSTIGRELRRNAGVNGYDPERADRLARRRRKDKVKPKIRDALWAAVDDLLRQDWSPEQIGLRLRKDGYDSVSHTWLYHRIRQDRARGGDLHRHLRIRKRRRRAYGKPDGRGVLANRTSIEQRPESANRRLRLGDWELDTMVGRGGRSALVTMVDRKSRLCLIGKSPDRRADSVATAIVNTLAGHACPVPTLTSDNGKEFARHQVVASVLDADFYFANPYASWERGTNENANGLIRQYFKKGCNIDTITGEEIERVMDRLNNRPRKCLGMKTPNEAFFGIKSRLHLRL